MSVDILKLPLNYICGTFVQGNYFLLAFLQIISFNHLLLPAIAFLQNLYFFKLSTTVVSLLIRFSFQAVQTLE